MSLSRGFDSYIHTIERDNLSNPWGVYALVPHLIIGEQLTRRSVRFGQAVRVSWFDSIAYNGWHYNPEKVGEVARIQSLGYVYKKTPHSLVMSTSIGNQGAGLDLLHIPWGAIAHLEVLPTEWHRT